MGAAPLSWLAKIGGDTLKTNAKLLSSAINELYDDGNYYGQCKIVTVVDNTADNGKTVLITTDDNKTYSGTIANKKCEFLLPPKTLYTVQKVSSGSAEFTTKVAAGYGDYILVHLDTGYVEVKQGDVVNLDYIKAATADDLKNKVPEANAVKELNGRLIASDNVPFRFGVNSKGEYGYIITNPEGADTVIPFSNEAAYTKALYNALKPNKLVNANMTFSQLIAVVASQNPTTYSLIRSGWTVSTAGGAVTPSASSNGSTVTLKIAAQAGESCYAYYTSPAINLSGFKTLTLQGTSYKVTGNRSNDDYRPKVKLLNASGAEVATIYAHPTRDTQLNTTGTIQTAYNCSSLRGNYYLRLQLFTYKTYDSSNVNAYITLTKALLST